MSSMVRNGVEYAADPNGVEYAADPNGVEYAADLTPRGRAITLCVRTESS